MYTVISVLIFIVCVLLVLFVLVQNSKGGGMASNFSAANQVMGVRKSADFLEKSTWYLAAGLLFLCLMAAASVPRTEIVEEKSALEEKIENVALPSQPVAQPAQQEEKPEE